MDSVSLYLSDILNKIGGGFEIKKTLLLRHKFSKKNYEKCYEKFPKEFTSIQPKKKFPGDTKDYKYFMTFISHGSKGAKFVACYEVIDKKTLSEDVIPQDYPCRDEDLRNREKLCYFELEETDILKEFKERLVIDWGKAQRAWKQWAKPKSEDKEKKILSISKAEKKFPEYDNLILPYDELKEVVGESEKYESWREHLSAINAIYLIVDRKTGKKYVGKACGKGGLLGRWTCYVETKHGGNRGMEEHLCAFPNMDGYEHFQFSILQIFSKDLNDAKKINEYENLYKDKLLTRGEFGLNRN